MQADIHSSFAIAWVARSSSKARKLLSPGVRYIHSYLYGHATGVQVKRSAPCAGYGALLMAAAACIALTGCGAVGYAGSGITSPSTSAITIDAGQSFQITAFLTGDEPVSWTLAVGSCSAAACGSLSSTTGAKVTYTAPPGDYLPDEGDSDRGCQRDNKLQRCHHHGQPGSGDCGDSAARHGRDCL
jgi:hypothetical protein